MVDPIRIGVGDVVDLVHQTKWQWWQLDLLDETDDWCCVRLEEFKAKPTVNLPRVQRIAQRVEERIDEEKVSRFLAHKIAVKEQHEQKEEERCRAKEEALAQRRISRALPSMRLPSESASWSNEDSSVRPKTVISKKSLSRPVAPPSEQGRCDGNAFVRNQNDLPPFVWEFFNRHRKFSDVEDALIHLRDNGLFSGQWEDRESRRSKRVGQILRFIEQEFDPKKLSNGEAEPLNLNMGKFSWWVRQKFGSGIRVKTADVRRFDPVSMTGPVVESFVPARFIKTFLVVVDFCLNQDPLDNKAVRANAIFTMFLFTGCRVSDLVGIELSDLMLAERSGSAVLRQGKGNKQRSVPLPLPARRALQAYLESRPPVESQKVFVGERGPLTDRGVRNLCGKFSAI